MRDYLIPKSFNPDGYRNLLHSFVDLGYKVKNFTGDSGQVAQLDKPHLILRHDIDMSLDAALNIAKVEAGIGFNATYFVLLRSEMYNIFSKSSEYSLKKIMEMGHKIGLHFDASQYKDNISFLDSAAQQECNILEDWLKSSVEIISFHRPAQKILGLSERLAGRMHTYQPHFFKHMGYCSDSRGAWHHGDPLGHVVVRNRHALQLLTHPIWWQEYNDNTVQESLDRFSRKHTNIFRNDLGNNCQVYDSSKPLV